MGKEQNTREVVLDEVIVRYDQNLYKLVARSYLNVRTSKVVSIRPGSTENLPGNVTRHRRVKVTLKA
ncbi:hypothetical protein E1281_38970 [Actinomadura sp. KC345]|uniref:hypothetical protein n=1 Tax=Actinomadura sp. KC345 TaxID=2530371 RepID=UPI0010438712|nr:hypothetical protein [Actinomadura sp. KC345]TDC38855.1 hypothetical protein E1281_38970 [Actinomadura sp. KC345]